MTIQSHSKWLCDTHFFFFFFLCFEWRACIHMLVRVFYHFKCTNWISFLFMIHKLWMWNIHQYWIAYVGEWCCIKSEMKSIYAMQKWWDIPFLHNNICIDEIAVSDHKTNRKAAECWMLMLFKFSVRSLIPIHWIYYKNYFIKLFSMEIPMRYVDIVLPKLVWR